VPATRTFNCCPTHSIVFSASRAGVLRKSQAGAGEERFFPERYQQGGYAKLADVIESHLATFTGRSKRDEERYKKKWKELFPEARLNALTPAALEQARAQLTEGRAVGTINHYFKFLRRVLNKAVRDGQLASNQPGGHSRRDGGNDRQLAPAQWDGPGATLRASEPPHICRGGRKSFLRLRRPK
jgi:hypothetical protein